jgi:hypothetical protein
MQLSGLVDTSRACGQELQQELAGLQADLGEARAQLAKACHATRPPSER